MGKKNWIVTLEDGEHAIELEHGYLSGKRTISVDDDIIEQIRFNLYDTGSRHEFKINGHSCIILITAGVRFSYDLIVDGISVKTGLPVEIKNTHFIKSANFLPRGIGFCAAGFTFGFLSRYGKPFIPVFLLCIILYFAAYFGSNALLKKMKKKGKE